MSCTDEAGPSPLSVDPVPQCLVQGTDNRWYEVEPPEDEPEDPYYTRCKALPALSPIDVTPSPCVAQAKWTAPACTGTAAERTFTCDGASDAVCTTALGDLGKDVPRCYDSEPDYYDWNAKPAEGACATNCGVTTVTWQCKKTTTLRRERQPLDPKAVKIRFDDPKLDDMQTVADDKCGAKPTATSWPCPCDTGAVSADALVYNGDAATLVFGDPLDGIASHTAQCNEGQECPQVDQFILAQSAVSPVYRGKDETLDHKTCDPTTGKIAGTDADAAASTRACQSSADSSVFWTRDFGAFNDEGACTAPCDIQGHAVTGWAYSCARRVVTDSGDVKGVLVPDAECTAAGKPRPNPPACNQHTCVRDYNWVVGPWALGDSTKTKEHLCSQGYAVTRTVACYDTRTGQVVDDSLCQTEKPVDEDERGPDTCGESAAWLISAYSACTFSAAGGVASRSVDCVVLAADGERYVKVSNDQRDATKEPEQTTACCLNGTVSANGCRCAPGFFGVACELGGGFALKVPNYQPYDNFRYFIAGATHNDFKGANVELLRIQGGSATLLARLATNVDVMASGVLSYGPTSDADDFFGAWLKLRIAAGNVIVESQPFVLNRPSLCDGAATYVYDEKRCQCPSESTLGGRFCHIDKCYGCDLNYAGCYLDEDGEVAAGSCCEPGRTWDPAFEKCFSPCSTTSCAHGGVARVAGDACTCLCTNLWSSQSNCQTCDLQCGTNGKADENCADCVCNRGFTTVNEGVCNCRSLVLRLALKRTTPLTTVERTGLVHDIATILVSKGVTADRVMVAAGTVQGSRLALDVSIKASSCFAVSDPEPTSNKDVKGMLVRFKLINWLKLDGEAEEFGTLAAVLSDALLNPDELPPSFQVFEFDASLGASITDPGCETDCMAPVSVGSGGPPLDGDMDGGRDDDDLKWIIPISVIIPLAAIVTGVLLYVKCKPNVKTPSSDNPIELETMTF